MKTRLRNITITLQEDLARWARVEAAQNDKSVSRFLAEILQERMKQKRSYDAAKRRSLARKPFLNTDSRYLSREEAHYRERLR